MGANLKYYFSDVGLRNDKLNFRHQEPTHIMEKLVIVNGTKKTWRNDEGFVIIGMKYFLLNADSLEF